MSELLLSFYGDDFTGSTDAMESLARGGIRTVLFTAPPTPEQIGRYDGLRAFGVAGTTRAMPPDEMERTLRPAFAALKQFRTPIVHYKVCSTFDSSPTAGSIGRAIDVGAEIFDSKMVPVIVGAPALGRYCVFGNLFVRNAGDTQPIRLDRHPSMSRHPTTPMDEADLRLHLAKQTIKPIGLIDVLKLAGGGGELADAKGDIVLIDLLDDNQLPTVGRLISASQFVVGSSGVEAALLAHWDRSATFFQPVKSAGPILAVCGSCSPVSARQVDYALSHGFVDGSATPNDAIRAIRAGQSAVLHARNGRPDDGFGQRVRHVLAETSMRRMLVAGGDTSGQIACALGIESLEMIGDLARGSPLCRAIAPSSPADGLEVTFKGGQIGPADFFLHVRDGSSHG